MCVSSIGAAGNFAKNAEIDENSRGKCGNLLHAQPFACVTASWLGIMSLCDVIAAARRESSLETEKVTPARAIAVELAGCPLAISRFLG